MNDKFSSKDLVLRLLHVEGLGHPPDLSEVDHETARELLLNRFGLDQETSDEELVSWFLTEHSGATDAERKRIAMARRIALIARKMVTKLKPYRRD